MPSYSFHTPSLKIDAILHPNGKMPSRCKQERRIAANLIRHMKAAGWMVASVYDGEEDAKVSTAQAAMELIFNLDDSRVYFEKNGTQFSVLLIGGNGVDLISDWSYNEGDLGKDFNAAVEAFLDVVSEKEGE